jgi:hypothetical protein
MVESEKLLERKLREQVESLLCGLCIKLPAIYFSGLPDRLCLLPGGRCFFVEVKTTGEVPSPIQLVVHKKLRRLGFRVEVIDSSEDIEYIIKDYE